MDTKQLTEILVAHKEWLQNNSKGRRADLREANLREADLDFACWPLWCGSMNVKVDRRLAAQLAAHFCVLDCEDEDYQKARAAVLEFAKTSHRARELGLLEEAVGGASLTRPSVACG